VARTELTRPVVRARLTVAADRLRRDGEDDLASAVDAVLAPRGWELLRPDPGPEDRNPNMSLFMPKDLKDALMAAAEEAREMAARGEIPAGDPAGNLTDDVDRGFRLFLSGKFTPTPPVRSKRGSNIPKTNLNVRPSGALRDEAAELAEAKSAELGWKLSVSRVAIAYLLHRYGIDEEEFTVRSGTGQNVLVLMPERLRTFFRQKEADLPDVSLDALAEQAMRAALAGEWTQPKVARGASAGAEKRDARLNVWIDQALYEELRTQLPVMSAQAGYQVSAAGIVTEWLKQNLGQPAE
jgi:hypothetical protein